MDCIELGAALAGAAYGSVRHMSEPISSPLGEYDPLALLAGFSQGTRLLRLTTPLGADVLLAECVRGEEGIGTCLLYTSPSPRDRG